MSDEDPTYTRQRRSRPGANRAIDGGAIAAGLCFGVFAIFVSIAGPLTTGFRFGFTTLCLLSGGIVAGHLTRPTASGALQGVAVTVCTAGLMAAVSVSISIGAGSLSRVPLVAAYELLSIPAFAAVLMLAIGFCALAGGLGARLRE